MADLLLEAWRQLGVCNARRCERKDATGAHSSGKLLVSLLRTEVAAGGGWPSRAARRHSLEAETAEVTVRLPAFTVRRAWVGSVLERESAEVAVDGDGIRVSLAPGQYRVVALDLERPS